MTSNVDSFKSISFDEEYGMEKLIPVSILKDMCGQLQKISAITVHILHANGFPYYSASALSPGEEASVRALINHERIETNKIVKIKKGRAVALFPLIHELETIGYLAVFCGEDLSGADSAIVPLGAFASDVLMKTIRNNYKYLMTSSLHGQVVQESFEELRKKAALLQKSERKYRTLAEQLEMEVEKKARKIKNAQAQLMQQEKMASIGQLAAGVAHEINNPTGFVSSNLATLHDYQKDIKAVVFAYRTLMNGLGVLADKGKIPAFIAEQMDVICSLEKDADMDYIMDDLADLIDESKEGTERIKKIVIDLKNFAHPGEACMQTTDINQCLESTLNVAWNEIKYKAEVTKDYGNLPPLDGCPQQLNQVFLNIFVNAVQAIEEKGEIGIVTRAADGYVEIAISDTGSGIPKENLSKVFDPFFTTKPVGKGTGLGMNVAYNIIKRHNGKIHVKSTVGKGTTFIIRLPA